MTHDKTDKLKFLFLLFPLLMAGLAIFGAIYSYSPVPFWDEWGGNIDFNQKIAHGDLSLWWAQHNEHRILWSRLLFVADAHWFGGVKLLLIPLNYLLVGLSCVIFWCGLRLVMGGKRATTAEYFLAAFISALLFSWSQQENLTWGFQSQFFLAQQLPLLAFYFLIKSTIEERFGASFLLACALGVAAAGTMANGVLALPLMFFYMLIMRQKLLPTAILALLTISTLSFYFYDYHAPSHHGSLVYEIKNHPLALACYIIFYLGNPFYHLFLVFIGDAAQVFAFSAGLFLLVTSTYLFIRFILHAKKAAPEHIFLFFILFVMLTALATGGGRLTFGVTQGFASRYATPVLMAWAALLIIFARPLVALLNAKNRRCIFIFLTFMALMSFMQLSTLKTAFTDKAFNFNVAGLALSLGVNDEQTIKSIFPNSEVVQAISSRAIQQQASFFGIYPYRAIEQDMGRQAEVVMEPSCSGRIDTIEPMETDADFVRVRGWLFNPKFAKTPQLIQFVNDKNIIVGYALSGAVRKDVAKEANWRAIKSGFSGYIRSQYSGGPIVLQGDKPACTIKLAFPPLLYSVAKIDELAKKELVSEREVLPDNQWTGTDYHKSSLKNMQVYGSYINSDADTGSILLKIKKGAAIYYRSGPVWGKQILEFPGSKLAPIILPTFSDWVLLKFDGRNLPADNFIIKLSDNGSAWGEWSAIALKKNMDK